MFRRLLFKNFKLFFLFSQQLRQRFTAYGLMMVIVMFAAGVFGLDTRATLSFQIFAIVLTLLITSMIYSLFFRGRFEVARKLPEYVVTLPARADCVSRARSHADGAGWQ